MKRPIFYNIGNYKKFLRGSKKIRGKAEFFYEKITQEFPCILVAFGFFSLFLLSWFGELLDFPHIFLNAQKTPFNWEEAFIESILIASIGFFTVLRIEGVI